MIAGMFVKRYSITEIIVKLYMAASSAGKARIYIILTTTSFKSVLF